MIFGWHIIIFGTLHLQKVNIPWSLPPISILALLGTCVYDAVGGVMSNFQLAMWVGALEVCLAWVNSVDMLCEGG